MYKIGIIGDKDSVLGFMAVGFNVFDVADAQEAVHMIHKLAADNYAIIYITEDLAEQISADIAKYKAAALPAIISIPGRAGSTGYGMTAIKKSVERAVGADIFKD